MLLRDLCSHKTPKMSLLSVCKNQKYSKRANGPSWKLFLQPCTAMDSLNSWELHEATVLCDSPRSLSLHWIVPQSLPLLCGSPSLALCLQLTQILQQTDLHGSHVKSATYLPLSLLDYFPFFTFQSVPASAGTESLVFIPTTANSLGHHLLVHPNSPLNSGPHTSMRATTMLWRASYMRRFLL